MTGGFVTTESPGKPFKGVFWVHSSPGTKSPKDPELSLWRVTPLLRTTSAFGQQHHPPANKTSPFLHPKQKASRLKSHSGAHCGSALRCGLRLFCSSLLCLCTCVLQSLQTISPTPSSCSGMSPSGNKGTASPATPTWYCPASTPRFWATHVPPHGTTPSFHEGSRTNPLSFSGPSEDGSTCREAQQPLALITALGLYRREGA